MQPCIIVIVGPTASGKSAFGVELARRIGGEIISADSRQVYRGLTIGTGKILSKEMRGVRHHMLDVTSWRRVYTAEMFARDARPLIRDVLSRGRIPIIVGGTGFYIDALLGRTTLAPVPPNPALRARLGKKDAAALFALLIKKDPKRAAAMDTLSERNNRVRLIRALEVAQSSAPRARRTEPAIPTVPIIWLGVDISPHILRKKIHTRLMSRMKSGMVAEAKRLHKKGLSYARMEALGLEYRALAAYLRGHISKATMLQRLEQEIAHYAKRQRTYWKRNPEIRWLAPKDIRRYSAIGSYLTERTSHAHIPRRA